MEGVKNIHYHLLLLSHLESGPCSFTIHKQIAAGCSSYVYSAVASGTACIVKELFPESLREKQLLIQAPTGRIILRKWPIGMHLWFQAKIRCLKAAMIALTLQEDPRTAQYVVHLRSVYIGNGTIYTVTKGLDGCAWDLLTGESAEQILQIGCRIADFCQELHQKKWLLVDIKASNFLVAQRQDTRIAVRLADFDSMTPLRSIRRQTRFLCSSETAPPELLANRNWLVGPHSDVYSIGAMLFRKLGGELDRDHIRETFIQQIRPRLSDWTEEQCDHLLAVFLHALELDPHKRLDSCQLLSRELHRILMQRGCRNENIQ